MATGPQPGTYFATTSVGASSPWNDVNYCVDICTDSDNNVYSLWNIASNNSYNGVLLKQDLDGNVLWKKYWDAGLAYGYSAVGVKVDSSDRPHVLCMSYVEDVYNGSINLTCLNPSDGTTNFQLTIFDPDYTDGQGNLWGAVSPGCLYIDENDKLYFVAAGNYNSSSSIKRLDSGIYSIGASSYTRVVVTKIGQSSTNAQPRTVGAYNSNAIVVGIAGSSSNHILLTHDTSGAKVSSYELRPAPFSGGSGLHYIDSRTGDYYASYYVTNEADIVVHKFNSSGVRQWSRRLNENTTYINRVFYYYANLTTDADGNVYLLCTVDLKSPAYFRPCVVKMDSSGTVQWVRGINWGQNKSSYSLFITTDTTGSVYIGINNTPFMIKMPGDGSLTGSWDIGTFPTGTTFGITSDPWLTSGAGGGVDNLGASSVDVSGNITPTTYAGVSWANLSPSPNTTLNLT